MSTCACMLVWASVSAFACECWCGRGRGRRLEQHAGQSGCTVAACSRQHTWLLASACLLAGACHSQRRRECMQAAEAQPGSHNSSGQPHFSGPQHHRAHRPSGHCVAASSCLECAHTLPATTTCRHHRARQALPRPGPEEPPARGGTGGRAAAAAASPAQATAAAAAAHPRQPRRGAVPRRARIRSDYARCRLGAAGGSGRSGRGAAVEQVAASADHHSLLSRRPHAHCSRQVGMGSKLRACLLAR